MILTEEDARTKWCPFVRLTNDTMGGSENRPLSNGGYNCIASDCMAWRFLPRYGPEGAPRGPSDKGFCGLAGNPS